MATTMTLSPSRLNIHLMGFKRQSSVLQDCPFLPHPLRRPSLALKAKFFRVGRKQIVKTIIWFRLNVEKFCTCLVGAGVGVSVGVWVGVGAEAGLEVEAEGWSWNLQNVKAISVELFATHYHALDGRCVCVCVRLCVCMRVKERGRECVHASEGKSVCVCAFECACMIVCLCACLSICMCMIKRVCKWVCKKENLHLPLLSSSSDQVNEQQQKIQMKSLKQSKLSWIKEFRAST